MVWNLGRESEMLLANSAQQDESHNEPISKVLWVQDPDSKRRSYNVRPLSLTPNFAVRISDAGA